MSRILKISESDYRVKVQSGGTITLDTGTDEGTVVVTGNLTVLGDTTSINTANMQVEDNILLLNREVDPVTHLPIPHTGITLEESGLEIDRGTLSNAKFVFDERISHYNPVTTEDIDGTFVLELANNERTGLQLSTLVASGTTDMVFDMKDTIYMLKLANTTGYSDRVTDDNHIPNRRWVTDYIESGSWVIGQADVDRYYAGTINPSTEELTIDSLGIAKNDGSVPRLEFYIRSAGDEAPSLRAKIISTGLYVDNINVFENTISQFTGTDNLILTAANGTVEVDAVLNLDDQASFVPPTSGTTKLYSRSQLSPQLKECPGKTGIFFSNAVNSDELVAKNRALLFSMIF